MHRSFYVLRDLEKQPHNKIHTRILKQNNKKKKKEQMKVFLSPTLPNDWVNI